mgnify:CR=1 FL=1
MINQTGLLTLLRVKSILDLGFGKCKLCVQAPVADKITDVETLAGKRIVTSFPNITGNFFKDIDDKLGVSTSITYVSGSVEAWRHDHGTRSLPWRSSARPISMLEEDVAALADRLRAEIGRAIVGQEGVVRMLLERRNVPPPWVPWDIRSGPISADSRRHRHGCGGSMEWTSASDPELDAADRSLLCMRRALPKRNGTRCARHVLLDRDALQATGGARAHVRRMAACRSGLSAPTGCSLSRRLRAAQCTR